MNIKRCELAGTYFNQRQVPADTRPKVLFLGRSNVGKSSLINSLLARRLARTSSTPGKTLSVNYYRVLLAAAAGRARELLFVDLPGYGYARIGQEETRRVRQLIADFLAAAENVRLAALLIDCRRGFLAPDLEALELLLEKRFPVLTILTKSDKISLSQQRNLIAQLKNKFGLIAISFSIHAPASREEAWQRIQEAAKE